MSNSPHSEGSNKKRHPFTILEAVDHLSNLAELDAASQEGKACLHPLNQKKSKKPLQRSIPISTTSIRKRGLS